MFVITLIWYINSNYTVLIWGWNQVAVITCRVKFRWCLWKNKLSSGFQANCHLYNIVFRTCGPRHLVHSALCSWLRGAGHDLSVLYLVMSQMLKQFSYSAEYINLLLIFRSLRRSYGCNKMCTDGDPIRLSLRRKVQSLLEIMAFNKFCKIKMLYAISILSCPCP